MNFNNNIMKNLFVFILLLLAFGSLYPQTKVEFIKNPGKLILPNVIREQIRLDANNMDTWIANTGIFNQDFRTSNTPGLMWKKGSNKFAFFTAGLSMAAYIDGVLKMAMASYAGEYAPGCIIPGGVPTPVTNSNFRLYRVTSTDSVSADYINWYTMIPYGAPYVDRNNNGQWDAGIDRPGIKNAVQTIFICMTDGFPETHNQSEGFSGGTPPMFSEMHLTAWAYMKGDSLTPEPLNDVQFFCYEIINKSTKNWNNTVISVVSDPDLGEATDDYIGCDTILKLAYCYNADNMDGTGNFQSYGLNPPAVGIDYLLTPSEFTGNPNDSVVYYNPPGSNKRFVKKGYRELGMTSFTYWARSGGGGISCEHDPSLPIEAYRYLSGMKKDGSPFFHPFTKQRTKKLFTGNPETREGWTEFGYNGNVLLAEIRNCLGTDSVTAYMSPPRDRHFLLNTGNSDYTVFAGDTVRIILGQMVARGMNNVNSVTKLKDVCRTAKSVYENNFAVSIKNISSEVPYGFYLGQNYPNPFNPSSKIKFDVVRTGNIKLIVYDVTGREVQTLVNEILKAGKYETTFDGTGMPSGVYFYKMTADGYTETKKMLFLK